MKNARRGGKRSGGPAGKSTGKRPGKRPGARPAAKPGARRPARPGGRPASRGARPAPKKPAVRRDSPRPVGRPRPGSTGEELERAFEGGPALQELLAASGSLSDVEDVATAFLEASRQGVPASVVIQALWEDEPRFESPTHARRLFGNLFGLYELIASGQRVELGSRAEPLKLKREKAGRPAPLPAAVSPDDDFVEAAWRWLDDHPKERERYVHAFNNRFDDLVSWLDESGLSDAGFALASHLSCDLFAMIDLAGLMLEPVFAENIPQVVAPGELPESFTRWIDEGVVEEEQDDEAPLSPHEGAHVREVTSQLVAALWAARRAPTA